MEFETLASGLDLAEGPRMDDGGTLYFGDAMGKGLYSWRDGEGQRALVPDQRNVGGCVIHEDGGVVCSTCEGFIRYDPVNGAIDRVDCSVDGVPIGRVNDIEAAPDGSLWGGTIDHEALETGAKMRPGFLFRIEPCGDVTRYMDIMIPNGIDFSDDGTRLYFSESGDGVYVYDVSSDGQLSGRRAFALMPDSDGIAMDISGGIWIARYQTNRMEYYGADGVLQQQVEVPFSSATSVCFGGADMKMLFVTGGHLEKKGQGGVVSLPVEVPGMRLKKTTI